MNTLKLKLKKIDALKYGIITGTLMAFIVFIMVGIAFLFTSLFGIGAAGSDAYALGAIFGGGIFMLILAPILYFVFGFIFGWISTMVFNFILKKTGGLDIEFEKTGLDLQQIGNE